jgi:hypothetical protein
MQQTWAVFAALKGFKITEIRPGMWAVLDQADTPFWWAYFTSEEIAAKAVCRHNGLTMPDSTPRHHLQEG